MKSLVSFFIHRPKVVNLLVVFLFLAGILALRTIENQGYPSVDFGVVNIRTVYPGASPEDVEIKVTSKIEEKLKGISGIKKYQSSSLENMSLIIVQIEDKADADKVKADISKAVDQVEDLPAEIKNRPVIEEVNSRIYPVAEVALVGQASYEDKRRYARLLQKKMEAIPQVSEAEKLGYLNREFIIAIDPEKAARQYVSVSDVVTALQNSNVRMSVGDIGILSSEKKLVVLAEKDSVEAIRNVVVRSNFDGKMRRIGDVAVVKTGYEPPDVWVRVDQQDAIHFLIKKKSEADMVEAASAVREVVTSFSRTLPKDIQAIYVVDYSEESDALLGMVISNGVLGFVLVLVILLLFLNPKVAFWTAMGIPTSVLFAFILFPVFGITFNFISLMALIIVLGMLVDDAILVGENIYRYREEGMAPLEAAEKGTLEVMWPVVTTVATTIVAFLPMLAMSGVFGKFMYAMPVVIALVLIGSLLESLFILPSHIATMKMSQIKGKSQIMTIMESAYEGAVTACMRHKWKTLFVSVLIFVASLSLVFVGLQFKLFPSDDGLMGYIKFELKEGTPIAESMNAARQLEEIVLSMPREEIAVMVTTIGEPTPRMAAYGAMARSASVGNIVLHLTPMKDRDRSAKVIMEEVTQKLKAVNGFVSLEANVVSDGPPVGKAITATLVGDNDVARVAAAEKLRAFLRKQPGVVNITDSEGRGKPRYDLHLEDAQMARLGVNPSVAVQTLFTAFEGLLVTDIRRDGETVDFRVRVNDLARDQDSTLATLVVPNNTGKLIPLSQVLTWKVSRDVQTVNHYDGDRSLTLYADLDTSKTKETAAALNKRVKAYLDKQLGDSGEVRVVFGGEEEDTQESMASLMRAMILALVGIYFILVVLFNSFFLPVIVMVAIPFSVAGVFIALFLHRMPLSFPAMIGLVGLTGVVVNNSLVMIEFFNQRAKLGPVSVADLAAAAKNRLRPIFLTTVTTAVGLFPTAYGFGGYNPVIVPMVLSIAWGLLFSTFITLFLIPALFVIQLQFRRGDRFERDVHPVTRP
jgi:multidrug efflux pump subunit AcrB